MTVIFGVDLSLPPPTHTHISKTLWDQYKSQIPFWGSRNKSQPQIWRFSGSSLSPLPTWKPSGHWCPFILWVSDSSYWPPRTGWAEEERTAGNWSREGRSWRCIILFDSVVWHWLTGFLVNDRRGNKTPEPLGSSWCLINWGKPQDDNLIKKKKTKTKTLKRHILPAQLPTSTPIQHINKYSESNNYSLQNDASIRLMHAR